MRTINVICYAERSGEWWEAFCPRFDLAVQGRSFHEVQEKLNDQITLFLETLATLPAHDRARLLNRKMPFVPRIKLKLRSWVYSKGRKGGNNNRDGEDRRVIGFCRPAHLASHG